jgi:hypothetical protein
VATTVAELVATLKADTSHFQKGMAQGESKLQSFTRTASKWALGIGAAIATGGVIAIKAASTQAEAVNKATVTFGQSAEAILEWSKTTARAMGIARTESLSASAGFGALFQEAGQAPPVAARFSQAMVKAAADLGSFHDVDPSLVLENLRSGLAGEAEPLRKFNIFMSEATIKAFAYKHGIAEAGTELTENQKILARQAFILGHVGKAQNDFAETSSSAANQQRIQSATTADLTATLGQSLLPAWRSVQRMLISVTGWMSENQAATKILIGVVASLATGILALAAATKIYAFATAEATKATLKLMLALAVNPVFLVIAAIVALGVALVVAYKKSETFRRVVQKVWEGVQTAVLTAVDLILRYIGFYLDALSMILHAAGKLPGPLGKPFRVAAEAIDKARGKVDELRSSVNSLKPKTIRVRAIVEGLGYVAALQEHLRLIRSQGVNITVGREHRQHGGPVAAGGVYRVGERGEETLVMGRSSGWVVPHAAPRPAMSGGDTHIHLYNHGVLGSEHEVLSWLRNAAARFEKRNGRSAF